MTTDPQSLVETKTLSSLADIVAKYGTKSQYTSVVLSKDFFDNPKNKDTYIYTHTRTPFYVCYYRGWCFSLWRLSIF